MKVCAELANRIFCINDESISDISSNRGHIYNYIFLNPGTHLRKIFKDIGLAMGDTQHHLSVLEKKGYIKSRKVGRHRHYYPMSVTKDQDELILAHLRQETTRDILVYLLEYAGSTQSDLSNFKHFSTSTIYWHMTRLISSDLVVSVREGKIIRYYVKDICSLTDCIRKYMPDTWNAIANKFADLHIQMSQRNYFSKQNNSAYPIIMNKFNS